MTMTESVNASRAAIGAMASRVPGARYEEDRADAARRQLQWVLEIVGEKHPPPALLPFPVVSLGIAAPGQIEIDRSKVLSEDAAWCSRRFRILRGRSFLGILGRFPLHEIETP